MSRKSNQPISHCQIKHNTKKKKKSKILKDNGTIKDGLGETESKSKYNFLNLIVPYGKSAQS